MRWLSRSLIALLLVEALLVGMQTSRAQGGGGVGGTIPPRNAVHPGTPAPGEKPGTTPICPPRTLVR